MNFNKNLMNSYETFLNANFELNEGLTICTTNHIIYYQLPSVERVSQISGGPYIHGITFGGVIAGVTDSCNQPYTSNSLCFYEQHSGQFIKSLNFSSKILGLVATQTHIFISLYDVIKVLDARNHQIVGTIDRLFSGNALAVSCHYVAWADEIHTGYIYLASVPDFSLIRQIKCHENPIQCISFSQELNLIFTASQKGTIIRSYGLERGETLNEYRRGFMDGKIICIDSLNGLICACSPSTIHVFYGNNIHLTISPNGIPVCCKLLVKKLFVITNQGLFSEYSIDIDSKSISFKNQIPLFPTNQPKKTTV